MQTQYIPLAQNESKQENSAVAILPPNVTNRDEIASIVNNYLTHQEGSNVEKRWDKWDYFYACMTFACCFSCSAYCNNPSEVTMTSNFYGQVLADTAAIGANPSLGKKYLGTINFQQLNEQNNTLSFGYVHVAFVPQGQYAKVTLNGLPRFLDAGYHVYCANSFQHHGLTNTNAEIIQHGNATVFNIPPGCVYIVNDPNEKILDNQIRILKQGHHEMNSKSMKFVKLATGLRLYPVEENIMTVDNYKLSVKANANIEIVDEQRLINKLGFSETLPRDVANFINNQVKSAFQEAGQQSSYRSQVDESLKNVQIATQDEGAETKHEVELSASPSLALTGKKSASIEIGIHDIVMSKLKSLEWIGIRCQEVQFNELMPDENTVRMLEEANRKAIEQKTSLAAARFAAQQTKINTDASNKAKLAEANADAEAINIRASALARANRTSPIANQLEVTKAVGEALKNVNSRVTFFSNADIFSLFRSGIPMTDENRLDQSSIASPTSRY